MHVWLILMNFTWIKHVYSIFQTYLGWQCQLTKIYLLGIGRNHKPDSVSAKIPCWAWLCYVPFISLVAFGHGSPSLEHLGTMLESDLCCKCRNSCSEERVNRCEQVFLMVFEYGWMHFTYLMRRPGMVRHEGLKWSAQTLSNTCFCLWLGQTIYSFCMVSAMLLLCGIIGRFF